MAADDINAWVATNPAGTDYIDTSDELIRANWAAVEEMVGGSTINLVITRPTAATVTITADRLVLLRDAAAAAARPPVYINQSAINVTGNITAAGANGLDAGAEAASTWYFIYIIRDTVNGATAALLSLSATAPTMPGTYNYKRLVGAVYNSAVSNFIDFIQRGNRVIYNGAQNALTAGGAVAYTQIAMTALLPSIARRALWSVYPINSVNNEYTKVFLADDTNGNYLVAVSGISRIATTWTLFYVEQELVDGIDVWYYVSSPAGTPTATLDLLGYEINV